MKKFRLLLLDANIVIEIFRQGIWDKLVDSCDIHLSRTVAQDEAQYYEDEQGDKHYFDLSKDITEGRITIFDILPSELAKFRLQFDSTYLERLDTGEAESLAYLMNSSEPCLICSVDSIVYKVLGNLHRAEQGIALEEILQRVGLNRQLLWQYTKKFRETWTNKGFQERFGGIGHKD